MTNDQQIQEIITLLAPEDPKNQKDAVFLVQRKLSQLLEQVAVKSAQIAILEAQLEVRSLEKHNVINEKLASEAVLKEEVVLARGPTQKKIEDALRAALNRETSEKEALKAELDNIKTPQAEPVKDS